MENNQKDTPKQEPTNPDVPPLSPEGKDTDNEKNSKAKTQSCQTPQQEPCNIIVKVDNTQKDKWTISNYIALSTVVVSRLLFLFTYKLFKQSQIQSTAATHGGSYKVNNNYSNFQE